MMSRFHLICLHGRGAYLLSLFSCIKHINDVHTIYHGSMIYVQNLIHFHVI